MRRALASAVVVVGLLGAATSSECAESKPIAELPGDLVRWSTMWMDIPQQMVAVGQEEGPLAAMTWGPVRGAAVFMNTTTKALWEAAQSEQRAGHQLSGKRPNDAIFRYEF